MCILYFIFILLSIVYSSFSFSFQADFESVSYLDESRHLSSTRDIYNTPYSLCHKDGIIDRYCRSMSILFGGKTFKEVYYVVDLANQPESYFRQLSLGQILKLISNYYLVPSIRMTLPSLGQLKYMMDYGYVKKIRQQGYWYFKQVDGGYSAAVMYYGIRPPSGPSSPTGSAKKGMLTRIVSSSFPSACNQNQCDGFYDFVDWTLQTASNSVFTTRAVMGYSVDGVNHRFEYSGQTNISIPASASGVWLDIWHAGMIGYVAKLRNLENKLTGSNFICVKIFGSLVVNHATISNEKCW